jgi:hypothetical protein
MENQEDVIIIKVTPERYSSITFSKGIPKELTDKWLEIQRREGII